MTIADSLATVARHGRLVLILGLVAGAALPSVAEAMRPWIGELVAGLLFLAALRVGPRQAMGALSDLRASLLLALSLQVAVPVAAVMLLSLAGWTQTATGVFVILLLAAAPISGSPNLAVLCGQDPAPALRQVIVGTALLPLTVVPVFWLMPVFGEPVAVLRAAAGLLVLIGGAAAIAFALRATIMTTPSDRTLGVIDGVSTIALAVVVIGLMSAVGPALRSEPLLLGGSLALVCAISFALQAVVFHASRRLGVGYAAPAFGIVAGCRNIALFLTVLPPAVVDPILLLIGCYQVPMYLTPYVMSRIYKRTTVR